MRIIEDEYNWKRAEPVELTLDETLATIEFEQPLKIYRIRGDGEITIFEDEELSEEIYSGSFPFEPEVPICCTGLTFVAEEGMAIMLIAEVGVQKTVLEAFLNTTEGMDFVNNGYNDDGTYSTAGLTEFIYNGNPASTLYVSSNHWIGFGYNGEQLQILRRDGCSTAIYRQEGTCGNGVKFMKIRFEGYTVYSQRVEANRLIYELFIMSNRDMFLNVVQTPTSGNTGSSNLICNNKTIALNLADTTGAGGGTMVSFYHLDEEGKEWQIVYDNYKGIDYFSYGFLIKVDGKYCTIKNGAIEPIAETMPTAADFYEFGFEEPPSSDVLITIASPQILYWKAGGDAEVLKDVVKAYLYPKIIRSDIDMSHISILGISMLTAQYSGDVRVRYSLDNEENFSDEIPLVDWLGTDVEELWNSLPENKRLVLLFVLHDNATISRFKITYIN